MSFIKSGSSYRYRDAWIPASHPSRLTTGSEGGLVCAIAAHAPPSSTIVIQLVFMLFSLCFRGRYCEAARHDIAGSPVAAARAREASFRTDTADCLLHFTDCREK